MSHDNDEPWFDTHEDFDLWYDTSETMNDYKECTNHQTFMKILVSAINPQMNISNRIFVLANVKHNYRTFEAVYFAVYYWILFPPVYVQQIPLSYGILYM